MATLENKLTEVLAEYFEEENTESAKNDVTTIFDMAITTDEFAELTPHQKKNIVSTKNNIIALLNNLAPLEDELAKYEQKGGE
jgi:hypothetical protein